jgi:hypothetical protein
MSNPPASPSLRPAEKPRPVSLFTTLFLMAVFAVFFFVVRQFYIPVDSGAQNGPAENLAKDLEWRSTSTSRRAALNELRHTHAQQATSYDWVDKNAGVVRLPIERAMELTVEKYGGQAAARPSRNP